jgi:hypothetical protein
MIFFTTLITSVNVILTEINTLSLDQMHRETMQRFGIWKWTNPILQQPSGHYLLKHFRLVLSTFAHAPPTRVKFDSPYGIDVDIVGADLVA